MLRSQENFFSAHSVASCRALETGIVESWPPCRISRVGSFSTSLYASGRLPLQTTTPASRASCAATARATDAPSEYPRSRCGSQLCRSAPRSRRFCGDLPSHKAKRLRFRSRCQATQTLLSRLWLPDFERSRSYAARPGRCPPRGRVRMPAIRSQCTAREDSWPAG